MSERGGESCYLCVFSTFLLASPPTSHPAGTEPKNEGGVASVVELEPRSDRARFTSQTQLFLAV